MSRIDVAHLRCRAASRRTRGAPARAARTALLAVLLAGAGAAQAGDCMISATPISFGPYDPITTATPIDSSGSIRVDCDPTTFGEALFGVFVTISLSQGSSGTYAARTLRQAPASILQYNLYTTAARATVWGNGSGGTQTVGGGVGGIFSGQPTPRSFPVYGRIPAGQDPRLGLHSDTITVAVVF